MLIPHLQASLCEPGRELFLDSLRLYTEKLVQRNLFFSRATLFFQLKKKLKKAHWHFLFCFWLKQIIPVTNSCFRSHELISLIKLNAYQKYSSVVAVIDLGVIPVH